MTPESVFSAASTLAMLSWLLLLLSPRTAWVQRVTGTVVPIVFATVYVGIIALRFGRGAGDFNSLAGVAALFSDPWTLLAGWIHYLAFDLLTGVWETRDATARGISRWLVAPCLLLTFLFGPAGWLLYRIVRATRGPATAAVMRA